MKIVLISTDETPVAMGVKALSSNLRAHGFETAIAIMATWNEDLNNFCWKDLEHICSDAGLIGISCMTHGVGKAIKIKNMLKRKLKIPIIIGGIHATLLPESLMDEFELICYGEGEDLIVELAKRLKDKKVFYDIPGLWGRCGDTAFRNQCQPLSRDLDEYPFPDYDLGHQFIFESNKLAPMELSHIICDYFEVMGSRGCPHSCTFCSNYKIKQDFPWRKAVRNYSVDYFIGHLKEICRVYPVVRSFWLEDDTFFAKENSEIQDFAERYKGEINKPFCILVSPWTYNEDKTRLLVEAGMDRVIFGIQSGSERTNHTIYGRKIYNNRMLEITQSLNTFHGLVPYYDFIGMNPFETREDLTSTIKLVRRFPAPFFIFSNNLAFYPGTKIREMALKAGFDISRRDRHTDAKHGYAILKNEKIKHKIFHLIFLLMGGKANKAKIGLVPRYLISDGAMQLYSVLDRRFSFLMNKSVACASILFIYSDWKTFLRRILNRRQITKLKALYNKIFKEKYF